MGRFVTKAEQPAPLDREAIDRIIGALTMGDVQQAFEAGVPDKAVAGVAFRRAAKRLGLVNGTADALDCVAATDVKYVGEAMKAAISDASPKSGSTAD